MNRVHATHNKRFKSVSDGSDESLGSPLGSDLDDVFLDVLSNGTSEQQTFSQSGNMQPGPSYSFPPEPDFDNDLKNGNVVKGHLVTLKGKDGKEKVFFLDPNHQFHPVIGANLTPVAIKVRFDWLMDWEAQFYWLILLTSGKHSYYQGAMLRINDDFYGIDKLNQFTIQPHVLINHYLLKCSWTLSFRQVELFYMLILAQEFLGIRALGSDSFPLFFPY